MMVSMLILLAVCVSAESFASRSFKTYPDEKWPDGVFYKFESLLNKTDRKAFKKAAQLWMDDTCIDFKRKRGEAGDLINVFKGWSCWSEDGRRGGLQFVSYNTDCGTIGTMAREIGRAIGLDKAHSIYDRDLNCTDEENTNIMVSSGKYNSSLSMGISFCDILVTNVYYNCSDICKDEPTPCQNGGFSHPRNCSECICPSGYGGQFCDERPSGCGESLEATVEWTPLEDKLDGEKAHEERDGYKRCSYWIKAPAGKKVEVEIVELPKENAVDGCVYAGVEIKTHPDQRRTGHRFCSKDDADAPVLTSDSSLVPVITYNSENHTTITKLEYRYV